MTDAPPRLFDRALRLERRRRLGLPRPGADFLHRRAAEGAADRLDDVARDFPRAALVWPGAPVWAEALAAHPKIGALRVIEETAEEFAALPEGGADLVVVGLSLHWADDPLGVLIQLRRALAPDGLLLATLFAGDTLGDLRRAFAAAEAEVEGGLSPRVAPMGELRDLGGLLQRAGFAMPVADAEPVAVTHADPLALMRDLRAMGEASVLRGRRRTFLRRATLARACLALAEAAGTPDGRVRTVFEIVTLTGWAPGPNQPSPKRPGSAAARLADALGARELRLPRE